MDTGLQKMKIVAYESKDFKTPSSPPDNEYEVLINPESYALSFGILSNEKLTQGNATPTSSFNSGTSQTLSFKFLFDGTGVVRSGSRPGGSNPRDVSADLTTFKNVVYNYNGKTHQPRFVQLQWGPLHYDCSLQSMTVTFKLFKPDGSPLRAEAACVFKSEIDDALLALKEAKQSPDLTHIRTVIEGDTLALLCYKEYGDSKYYYQVGEVNRLTDFKRLVPGTKLIFPPITK
jgi:phage tail protein X